MKTEQSPRIENGEIKWYEGDAFVIYIDIRDKSNGGSRLELREGDYVMLVYRRGKRVVYREKVSEMVGGLLLMKISERITGLFKEGSYEYDIVLHREEEGTIQTVLKCGKIEVEGCQCEN